LKTETQTWTPKKEVPSPRLRSLEDALEEHRHVTESIPKEAAAVKKVTGQKESSGPLHEKKDVPVAEPSAPAFEPQIEATR